MTGSGFLRDLLIASAQLDSEEIFKFFVLINNYRQNFEVIDTNIYQKLNEQDQATFVLWFLRRWGGIQQVPEEKLRAYDEVAARAKDPEHSEVDIAGKTYRRVNFLSQGYDFDLIQYAWVLGIHDIYYNQYEHGSVSCDAGDVIIDAGAFIGDTAVLFDHKTGGDCDIHCFELLEENLALLKENVRLNDIPDARLHVNQLALTSQSGEFVEIDEAPLQGATKIGAKTGDGVSKSIPTITIDDYVANNGLSKVDFIKMDIEGAELDALQGARRTIQEKKPKLAVCLYHLPEDPVAIPRLINEFCPDYQFYFKWVHLRSGWEAVLLADARNGEGMSTGSAAPHTDTEKALQNSVLNLLDHFSEKYKQADGLWKAKTGRKWVKDKIKKVLRKLKIKIR